MAPQVPVATPFALSDSAHKARKGRLYYNTLFTRVQVACEFVFTFVNTPGESVLSKDGKKVFIFEFCFMCFFAGLNTSQKLQNRITLQKLCVFLVFSIFAKKKRG